MSDLSHGVPDEELMKKYGLSEDALKSLFDKVMKAMAGGSRDIPVDFEE